MDVEFEGLAVDNPKLSGIPGETARPVVDEYGSEMMEGYDAFRGPVWRATVCPMLWALTSRCFTNPDTLATALFVVLGSMYTSTSKPVR